MSNSIEMKPGLSYIDERNSQYRYSDSEGMVQWVQPLSKYKAFTEIKRGQAVSIATAKNIEDYGISIYSKATTTNPSSGVDTVKGENQKTDETGKVIYDEDVYTDKDYGFVTVITHDYYWSNSLGNWTKETINSTTTTYLDSTLKSVANFPYVVDSTGSYDGSDNINGWTTGDVTSITDTYTINDNFSVTKVTECYNKTLVDKLLSDPDSYVIPTDTKSNERSVGLAGEYAAKYGDSIHVQGFGKFTYDPKYEGKNPDFYGKDNPNHDAFDHTNKEYNPGFTYSDVGKKVYVAYPENGDYGFLTVDGERVSKFYHNIICIGELTDAPQKVGEGTTTIEISISGDQRGLLEATQNEYRLGEDMTITQDDPVRVLALGQESDTTFKARLCLTPQASLADRPFQPEDFIAFQKMDGATAIIHFTDTFGMNSVEDLDDQAFLHMARSYASVTGNDISYFKVTDLNDTQSGVGVSDNIKKINGVIAKAFGAVSGFESTVTSGVSNSLNDFFGYIDIESQNPGGYFTMYVSTGIRDRFENSITYCSGSYENHGLAVLADIRVPTRRTVLGIYNGSKWGNLEKGYTTIVLRVGEFDIPEKNNQLGGFHAGQDYWLGMNGRVVTQPYNQFDFVSKIGFIKLGNEDDLRFVVDVNNSTRRYNGDLPVGYMKPAIKVGTEFVPEYGFLIMDGTTTYPIAKPYDTLYERLLGWFDSASVNVTGDNSRFTVPKVVRMMPTENGSAQEPVCMQIKYIPTGIYEEMPHVPFKRFFGRFKTESQENVIEGSDWTPIKPIIEDCDITDIIDSGINDDGYELPTLDNLDIHLYIDPNENYISGPHDWHEVHEGFFNYNNTTTFGFTWKITEHDASLEHPYGCYTLSMELEDSEGVAYVTGNNQAPKKLNGCHYKIYVTRREVFHRQFDIEKVYKDYLTNTVYSDRVQKTVVLDKACTGKAVIDAIENRYEVQKMIGKEDGDFELGSMGAALDTLILNAKKDIPIISNGKITLQNEEDNPETVDNTAQPAKLVIGVVDDVTEIYKDGAYNKTSMLNTKEVDGKNVFTLGDDIIPTVGQVRGHTIQTIDGRDYLTYYATESNQTGKIHGMVFGRDGNLDVRSVWGFEPRIASGSTPATTITKSNAYIPLVTTVNNNYELTIEGTVSYQSYDASSTSYSRLVTKSIKNGLVKDYGFIDTDNDNIPDVVSGDSINSTIEKINVESGNSVFTEILQLNGINKVEKIWDLSTNPSLKLIEHNGTSVGGLSVYAGKFTSASRSKFKRIYGELIRDKNLIYDVNNVSNDTTTQLAPGSIKYDEKVAYTYTPDETLPEETFTLYNNTNKLKSLLGSALQAAYELPLAYWQYNTEKEWYKDSLGIIIERVEDVARNISGNCYSTATIGNLIVTAKKPGVDGDKIGIKITSDDNVIFTLTTFVDGKEVDKQENLKKVEDLVENTYVSFSGTGSLVITHELGDRTKLTTVSLTGGTDNGTTRALFDTLYDTDDVETPVTQVLPATATIGNLVVTAIETGKVGNGYSIKINAVDNGKFTVVTYKGTTELDSQEVADISELVANAYVSFKMKDSDATLAETTSKKKLSGGTDGTEVTSPISANTNYKENEYTYTDAEAKSIKEFLNTIIDQSSNGQNITSSVGMLMMAAKETQERLLRLEASTFGRDYETIPGGHLPYVIKGMDGVVPDPTNYGLNRLIRAICQELYYDTNPFDEALVNGNKDSVSSFSRIDRIDREIHGEINTDNNTTTAPNILDSIDSSTYPYEDMLRAKDDTEVRESEFELPDYKDVYKRGVDVATRVDMMNYQSDEDGWTGETTGNTADDKSHFNGIVDAIYRITTKLNALTESINNGDNIANAPIRLNTIRQNIEHIIRESYFDDEYVINPGESIVIEGKEGCEATEQIKSFTRTDATTYHDVNGAEHAPYTKDVSRFDKITENLFNYAISVEGEGEHNFGIFQPFGDETTKKGISVADPVTGEVHVEYTNVPVQYTGRKFNGKHLLTNNKPISDGTDVAYTLEPHVPQNLNDYNYATLIDIVVDAIGSEFFRKQASVKQTKDDFWNAKDVLRHNETISQRLDAIEGCLDKVVGKLSRKHAFEFESDITNNNTKDGGSSKGSEQKVFSVDTYLEFLNEYLGYYQTTDNLIVNKGNTTTEYTSHWANGLDVDLNGNNVGIDGDPQNGTAVNPIGMAQYSAEFAFRVRKNIHAGLVNTLARLQQEEARSNRVDTILGEEFSSVVSNQALTQNVIENKTKTINVFTVTHKDGSTELVTYHNSKYFIVSHTDNTYAITSTVYEEKNGDKFDVLKVGGEDVTITIAVANTDTDYVKEWTASSDYNLTDDIRDILLTLYGVDYQNFNANNIHLSDAYTDYQHRTLVGTTNNNSTTRFVSGDSGNNIVDMLINDIYFLPKPIRAYNEVWDKNVTVATNSYLKSTVGSDMSGKQYAMKDITKQYTYVETDNITTDSAKTDANSLNNRGIRDSRTAVYYDFDSNEYIYDIPNDEYALSFNNRNEFFNKSRKPTEHTTDSDIASQLALAGTKGYTELHARLNRFDVLENEVRVLRHLIGLDVFKDCWNGNQDLVDLKFNGNLLFEGTRYDGKFNGYDFTDGTVGTLQKGDNYKVLTDQFNQSSKTRTTILKFLLNNDKSNRLLRTELGFTDGNTNQFNPFSDVTTFNVKSGYDVFYDPFYSDSSDTKDEEEKFLTQGIKDGNAHDYSNSYGLYHQNITDKTARHTIYDRLFQLEQNAVRMDAWMDSVKNIYHNNQGKKAGTGNLFDIFNRIGLWDWDNGNGTDNNTHFYGAFRPLDMDNMLRLASNDSKSAQYGDTVHKNVFNDISHELNAHNKNLLNIYDVIGTDENNTLVNGENLFVFGEGATDIVRTDNELANNAYKGTNADGSEIKDGIITNNNNSKGVEKRNTIWGRINALETLNAHDVDLTNVITVKTVKNNNNGVNEANNTTLETRTLGQGDVLVTDASQVNVTESAVEHNPNGAKEMIASKSYVDSAINVAINNFNNRAGDLVNKDIDKELAISEDKVIAKSILVKNNDTNKTDYTGDTKQYYDTATMADLIDNINSVLEQNQKNTANLAANVEKLFTATQYSYSYNNTNTLTQTTTGSLLSWSI